MAFCDCFPLFLVFLSISFLITSPLASPQAVVEIRNDLPNTTTDQLKLSCGQGSWSYLKLGNHYNQTLVSVDQDFECTAMWSRWFTTWAAYKSNRDKGHDTIYWSVKEDGFYLSCDGSNWNLVERWYTES